jgi:hypothetical protein
MKDLPCKYPPPAAELSYECLDRFPERTQPARAQEIGDHVASGSKKIPVQTDVTSIPLFFLRHPDGHVA